MYINATVTVERDFIYRELAMPVESVKAIYKL